MEIIHQDDSFLVVNKPTGLLSVPGRGPDKQDCVYHRVLDQFLDALVVHRLDMETSGLMLFARTAEAQRNISMQFEKREIHKTYIAIVEGLLNPAVGMIDLPMRKDMEHRLPPKHIIDVEQGKKAITKWKVLGQGNNATRVELYPQTGRSHQLRVHMLALGHPIVGDPIYGTRNDRLMLHAETLELKHPVSGEVIQLECSAPF